MAAIYQWFVGDEVVYTTTLYPIDVTESLAFSMTTNPYGNLSNFPVDNSTTNLSMISVEVVQILISGDTGEDYSTMTLSMISIEIDDLLQTADAGEDSSEMTLSMISIEIVDLLIHCDTPDESLQLSCVTNAANSSLTPV